jgi:hypothetical protein
MADLMKRWNTFLAENRNRRTIGKANCSVCVVSHKRARESASTPVHDFKDESSVLVWLLQCEFEVVDSPVTISRLNAEKFECRESTQALRSTN